MSGQTVSGPRISLKYWDSGIATHIEFFNPADKRSDTRSNPESSAFSGGSIDPRLRANHAWADFALSLGSYKVERYQ